MPDDAIGPLKPADTFVRPADPKPYIRTFAQDMAAASGAPAVKPVPPPPSPTPTPEPAAPAPAPEPVPAAPAPAPQPLPPPPTLPAQPVPGDAFWYPATPSQPTAGEQKSEPVVPQTPTAPAASNALPSSVDTAEGREAILARLRSKLASHQSQPIEPIRTAAPDLVKTPEPVLPTPAPAPVPQPVPQPAAVPVPEPAPLHTYSSDFAERIDTSGATRFSVLAAQSDAGQPVATPAAPKRSFRKIAGVSLAIVVMLGATIAGVGYLLSNPLGGSEPVSVVEDPSSVRFDQRIAVTGTGPALREQIADAAEEAPSTGSIVDIAPDSLGTDPFGTLGIRAPSILTRNLEGEVTIGGVRTDAGAHPFMVLPVSSYERTFAGMLAWEATMRESLAPWYPEYQAVLATSTSASSASSATVLPFFVDTVVENRDVRALRDTAGRTVLLYGYADKETLLIVRDEDAFSAVLARLSR